MTTPGDWERRSGSTNPAADGRETERSGRTPARRDHDRVFYAAEFERLEDVTQIATLTSSSVRNRLTHSYRVEQIAQAIAVRHPAAGIDVDVVATAALVHDIGHAPFGHTGEEALQRVVSCENHRKRRRPDLRERLKEVSDPESNERTPAGCDSDQPCILLDGFEGNAQSYRILTLLGSNHPNTPDHGLDLTRRVLLASLKYPWLARENPAKLHKWGVYDLDLDSFMWLLNASDVDEVSGTRAQTLEASVMDVADDIAYAVHDLEDAYKIGLVPVSELQDFRSSTFLKVVAYIRAESEQDDGTLPEPRHESEAGAEASEENPEGPAAPLSGSPVINIIREWERFAGQNHAVELRAESGDLLYPHLAQLKACLNKIGSRLSSGGLQSRMDISRWRAYLISLFVNSVVIVDGNARIGSSPILATIEFLKQITWYFVIDDPDLTAIREGQENLVASCFTKLFELTERAYLTPEPATRADWRQRPLHRLSKRLPERLNDYVILGARQLEAADGSRCTPRQVVARAVVDYICSLTDDEVYSYSLQLDGAPSHSVPRLYRR